MEKSTYIKELFFDTAIQVATKIETQLSSRNTVCASIHHKCALFCRTFCRTPVPFRSQVSGRSAMEGLCGEEKAGDQVKGKPAAENADRQQ